MAVASYLIILGVLATGTLTDALTMHELLHRTQQKRSINYAEKKSGQCAPWKPFQCPDGECIPIKYLCDGSPDCGNGYDENESMCTAAVRPPVEETTAFLKALLESHGKDFLSKIFGPKAADAAAGLGGVEEFAIALSESPTVEDFGTQLGFSEQDIDQAATILNGIAEGKATGFQGSEASDFQFFAAKLKDTGFM